MASIAAAAGQYVILMVCLIGCNSVPNYEEHITRNVILEDNSYTTKQFRDDLLKNLENKFAELENNLNSQISRLLESQCDNQLQTFDGKIMNIDEKVTKVDEKIMNIDEKVTKVDEKMMNIDEKVTKVDEKIMNIDEKVTKIDEKVMNIDEIVIQNDEKITKIADKILNIEENTCTTASANITEDKIDGPVDKIDNNCDDILKGGDSDSGVRTISPFVRNSLAVEVYCDQHSQAGGWTVIQRRDDLDVREDFFRGWEDYETGFGNRTGEYWLGLKTIHALTESRPMELMVSLEAFDGVKGYASYKTFFVGNEDQKYELTIGNYTGDAGDSFKVSNRRMFSTTDNDNDRMSSSNCANDREGAWWYDTCSYANLNGPHVIGKNTFQSIFWSQFKAGQHLRRTSMMVRPLDRTN